MGSRNWRRGEIMRLVTTLTFGVLTTLALMIVPIPSGSRRRCAGGRCAIISSREVKELACTPNGARPMRLVRPCPLTPQFPPSPPHNYHGGLTGSDNRALQTPPKYPQDAGIAHLFCILCAVNSASAGFPDFFITHSNFRDLQRNIVLRTG